MASEKTAPQLSVGGACISVALEMAGVEGRYPVALEVWSRRERQLQQSLEWQSFQQNIEQVRQSFPLWLCIVIVRSLVEANKRKPLIDDMLGRETLSVFLLMCVCAMFAYYSNCGYVLCLHEPSEIRVLKRSHL